jgi:hypothetical protein
MSPEATRSGACDPIEAYGSWSQVATRFGGFLPAFADFAKAAVGLRRDVLPGIAGHHREPPLSGLPNRL